MLKAQNSVLSALLHDNIHRRRRWQILTLLRLTHQLPNQMASVVPIWALASLLQSKHLRKPYLAANIPAVGHPRLHHFNPACGALSLHLFLR